jgi:hypothetical protein
MFERRVYMLMSTRWMAPVLTFTVTVASLTVLHAVGAWSAGLTQQAREKPSEQLLPKNLQLVQSESELRAKSLSDRAKAKFFDFKGPKLLTWGSGNMYISSHDDALELPSPHAETERPPSDPLAPIVCASDSIVIGRATTQRALLNTSESFLFTDFRVAVLTRLKPTTGPEAVSVAAQGGAVRLGKRTIRAIKGSLPRLENSSLLFLMTIPGTDGYVLLGEPLAVVDDGARKTQTGGVDEGRAEPQIATRIRTILSTCGAK